MAVLTYIPTNSVGGFPFLGGGILKIKENHKSIKLLVNFPFVNLVSVSPDAKMILKPKCSKIHFHTHIYSQSMW